MELKDIRTINYCWFGRNELDENVQRCIQSWREYLPEYEIVEWNEDSYDVNANRYIREAYSMKKWAFVSDYARLDILYRYGGLYFDTDVELIRPIYDIIEAGPFVGCQKREVQEVNPGLGMGVIPGMSIVKEFLDYYSECCFINPNGTLNQKTIVDVVSGVLKRKGFVSDETIQEIAGLYIYPHEYFCPMNCDDKTLNITDKTRSIHFFDGSWLTEEERNILESVANIRRTKGKLSASIVKNALLLKNSFEKEGFPGIIKYTKQKMNDRRL